MEEKVNNKLAYLVVFVVLFSAIVLGLSTFKDAYSFYTAIVSTGVQTVAASGRCGDVDGDGDVDNDDAIYLLRYTLFPSQFPLAYNGNTADVYHL